MRFTKLLLLSALIFILSACDGFTHIKGKVVDENGKPVPGALVELKTDSGGRTDQARSEADGSFSVGFSHAPFKVDLTLTVSKEGYKIVETKFKSTQAKELPTTIVLLRQPTVDFSK